MSKVRLVDAQMSFKIHVESPAKKTYMLYMLHALGFVWASGSTYMFSLGMANRDEVVFLAHRCYAVDYKYVITWETYSFDKHDEILEMKLNELEYFYKKELSLYGIPISDQELVKKACVEYYDSILDGGE